MKKKLLLHSCCGPCSTVVIERLKEDYDLSLFYYNPNIEPFEEYTKRKLEEKKVCEYFGVPFIEGSYDNEDWLEYVKGLENEKEGGARCAKCFEFRLNKTAEIAKEKGFDLFATTLSVSPHKNTVLINQIGENIKNAKKIDFLSENFKKKDGYLRSIQLSKELGLYRQNYCGCHFARREDERI